MVLLNDAVIDISIDVDIDTYIDVDANLYSQRLSKVSTKAFKGYYILAAGSVYGL